MTKHLDVGNLHYGRDLLEAGSQHLQTHGHVLVEEDGQVGSLRLDFALVNPALNVPVSRREILLVADKMED